VLIDSLLTRDGVDRDDITAAVMASVVPPLTATVSAACESLFGMQPLVVGPGTHTGLEVRTDNPREVGPDRIANAVAASVQFGEPVMILDFTTALIIDVVGAGGEYMGAIIAPGMGIAAEALSRRTAQLQLIEFKPPPRAIARNTEHGLQSGLVLGYLGLVEGLVKRAQDETGPAPVVATGEAAWLPGLLAQTDVVDAYEPLLTVTGLRLIYDRHTSSAAAR
jgi:type III pantothenate kinase